MNDWIINITTIWLRKRSAGEEGENEFPSLDHPNEFAL
jgi:hypothetical protein